MSLTAKLVAVGIVIVALMAGAWKFWHTADKGGYARAQAEYQAAAEQQREANRGRARQAEESQSVRTVYRDRYIFRKSKELDDVTQDLSRCPVRPPGVRVLNDAARCTDEDRPAACGAGDGMPPSR